MEPEANNNVYAAHYNTDSLDADEADLKYSHLSPQLSGQPEMSTRNFEPTYNASLNAPSHRHNPRPFTGQDCVQTELIPQHSLHCVNSGQPQYGAPAVRQHLQQDESMVTNYNVQSERVTLAGDVTINNPKLQNIRKQTRDLIRDSGTDFVITTGYLQAASILDKYGHVTLIGEPGSGKTAIAHNLLKSYKKSFVPLIVDDPLELRSRDPKEPTLVLVNDIFGKSSYSVKLDKLLPLFEKVTKTLNLDKFRIIFTSRNYIFFDAKQDLILYKDSLLHENSIVDLSGDASLTVSDKLKIFELFLDKEGIPVSKEDINKIVSMKTSYGFPHACYLFATLQRWHLRPVEFFKKPIDVIIESLQHLYKYDEHKFAVLLILLLCEGKMNIARLRKVSDVPEFVQHFIGDGNIRSFLNKRHELVSPLLGCYLVANGDTYTFRHPTVEDTVAYVIGKSDPLFLIENCSMSVISERVRIHNSPGQRTQEDSQWFHVVLSDDYHEDLIERFMKEIKERHFSLVCLHQACSQERFLDKLFDSLKENSKLNNLIHLYDCEHHQNMLYWSAVNKSSVMFTKIIKNFTFRSYEEHNAVIVCCITGNTAQLQTFLGSFSGERKRRLLNMSITRDGMVTKTEDVKKFKMCDDRLLNIACRYGHKNVIDILIETGFSVNGEENAIPPVHSCCENGHVDVLVHLHELGANLETKLFDGKTCLHTACQNGHLSVVLKCIELGAVVDSIDRYGQTPLLLACKTGYEDIAKCLLDNNAMKNANDFKGRDTLYYACQGGCFNIVYDILTENPKAVEKKYIEDETLLHCIAVKTVVNSEARKLDLTKLLIQEGADLNSSTKDGMTPLLLAAESGYLQIVETLIEKGAQTTLINSNGETFFHKAAQGNILHELKCSLTDIQQNANRKDRGEQTALHKASIMGSTQVVKYLLKGNAEVNAVDASKHTPLHLAALNGHTNTVQALLKNNADINAENNWNQSPLHLASDEGKFEVVKTLLMNKAEVNATDASGQTPLHFASATWLGGVDTVLHLLVSGANVNAVNDERQTALHLCAGSWGRVDTMQILLAHGADVDARDERMQTPLHLASLKGHLDVMQLLLDKGADVDAQDESMQTSLHLAAENSEVETLQILLDNKAEVNASDSSGFTPLHLAANVGRNDNVALLLKTADGNARDNDGQTALHLAAMEGKSDSAKLLVTKGVNINITDKQRRSPLHTCSENGRLEVTEVLLKLGADTNVRDEQHKTPLHLAAGCDRQFTDEIVEMLLDHGADVNAIDVKNQTPLQAATLTGLCESVHMLISYNADVNAKDIYQKTPLHHAVLSNRCDIIQELLINDALLHVKESNGRMAIHLAAMSPRQDSLKLLIRYKADVNVADTEKKTALHYASALGRTENVKVLIAKGANVNAVDVRKQTSLHLAACNGQNDVIKHLLQSKIDILSEDENGLTALDLAKQNHKQNAVKLIIDNQN